MGPTRSLQAMARGFAVASALGSGFAVAVVAGVLGGLALDRALGFRPIVFTVALGLLGGVAGGVAVIRTLQALERSERRRDSGGDGTGR